MTQCRRILALVAAVSAVSLSCLVSPARAQPSADQVLADIELSAADKQRVLNGEFVTADVATVSERDLSLGLAFLVKASPEALSKQIAAGDLVTTDPQVQAYGKFSGAGSAADLAGLRITGDEAKALSNARAGEAVNLGTGEIAAFTALSGGTPQAVLRQLQAMLLARYRAYRASGLAGIVPYDRGGGSSSDPAGDLRKASEAAQGLKKYLPALQGALLSYPKAPVPGMREEFFWAKYNIEGKPTYVLTHLLVVADGAARALVQRQYYASTGYNAEQAVAGFLPVQGGTVVVYASHAFTDQVAGFGGSVKRGVGRRVMADKMKQLFEANRKKVER
jgi:hypothetical protein